MADPAPQPLTQAEQAQLEKLSARKAASDAAQAEQARITKLAALAPVKDFVDIITSDDARAKLELAIIAASGQDRQTTEKLMRLRTIIEADGGDLKAQIVSLGTAPVVIPVTSAEQTTAE